MPGLLISLVNRQWVATIANTQPPITYRFLGNLTDQQAFSMHTFAQDMISAGRPGGESIAGEMDTYFDLGGKTSQVAYTELVEMTDGIVFAGRPIFTAVLGFIKDELDLAGRALLRAVEAL